jgi:cytochrome P450
MSISLPNVVPSAEQTEQHPLPPALRGQSFLRALAGLLRQQPAFLNQARQAVGDIYTLDLGAFKTIMLNHPNHVQHVLRDHARNYGKGGALNQVLRQIFGNGLPFSEGDFWLRQRRLLQPQFHRQRLTGLTDTMVDASEEGLALWQKQDDKPVNLSAAFSALTVRIITRIMFGSAVAQAEIEEGARAVAYLNQAIMPAMLTRSLPDWLPVPGRKRFQQAVQTLDKVVYKVVARRQMPEAAGVVASDLVSLLSDIVDEETGEPMSQQQIRDEAVTMFVAGYETTSTTLTWALHLLLQHPDKLAKLQQEIDTVVGDQRPTFTLLTQLPYARMVIQEALRIRPPVWWIMRTSVAEDVIDGYRIPAGANVILPIYAIHHHPDFWQEPEKFEPERFSPERSQQQHPFAWAPFGAGQRLCIGRDLALLEGQLILALALQRFRFTPLANKPVHEQLATTLIPKDGVWVRISRKDDRMKE